MQNLGGGGVSFFETPSFFLNFFFAHQIYGKINKYIDNALFQGIGLHKINGPLTPHLVPK